MVSKCTSCILLRPPRCRRCFICPEELLWQGSGGDGQLGAWLSFDSLCRSSVPITSAKTQPCPEKDVEVILPSGEDAAHSSVLRLLSAQGLRINGLCVCPDSVPLPLASGSVSSVDCSSLAMGAREITQLLNVPSQASASPHEDLITAITSSTTVNTIANHPSLSYPSAPLSTLNEDVLDHTAIPPWHPMFRVARLGF